MTELSEQVQEQSPLFTFLQEKGMLPGMKKALNVYLTQKVGLDLTCVNDEDVKAFCLTLERISALPTEIRSVAVNDIRTMKKNPDLLLSLTDTIYTKLTGAQDVVYESCCYQDSEFYKDVPDFVDTTKQDRLNHPYFDVTKGCKTQWVGDECVFTITPAAQKFMNELRTGLMMIDWMPSSWVETCLDFVMMSGIPQTVQKSKMEGNPGNKLPRQNGE